MRNKISHTDEKENHKHRGKKKTTNKQNHTWAGKKQSLLKKSPEVTSKGEDSNKHFNPVKNYFVFPFWKQTIA